ncbi:MAG: SUMF1/EgtB/PvdO family nonheme iron enzyme [Deltaproteobacteria bacterium]|nr:SUMF1/EgtB/PvdO family nonheme iron enzyme [Deltaproteobacteria bacterium]
MIHIEAMKIRGILSPGFWIDRQVGSSHAFNACIKAGECGREPIETRLVERATATWFDAVAYCRWRGARLPTNRELFQAEPSLRVDGEVVWSSDTDPHHPYLRLTQSLSSLPRGWAGQWPPPGLDARSEPVNSEHAFRCAR